MEDGLFREEALRRWREGGTKGEVLRLAPGWTTRAVAWLLVAAVGAAVAAFFVTVPVSVQGPATVTAKDEVLVLLPAARRGNLRNGQILLWSQGGRVPLPLKVRSIEPGVVGRDEARSLAGGAFVGRPVPEVSLVVWAIPAGRIPRLEGAGKVSLPPERRRLFDLLLPGNR